MSLFHWGEFTSHSGLKLSWKIDCDFLTDEDWDCIAQLVASNFQFRDVWGIPKGGIKLAEALHKFTDPASMNGLIVDDVYTTGKSMEEMKTKIGAYPGRIHGVVLFYRGAYPTTSWFWVRPIFTLRYPFGPPLP